MNALRFLGAMTATFLLLAGAGAALAALFLPKPVRYFHTSYMEFAIPDTWRCHRTGTEFICEPRVKPESGHRALMVVAAKHVGPMDDRQSYLDHLSAPRRIETEEGERLSVVEDARVIEVDGREWVYGAHFGSEIPGYRTRYYVSDTGNIAAAVTFSTHESVAGDYDREVDVLLGSLKLFDAEKGGK